MIKFVTLLFLIVTRLIYHPSHHHTGTAAFDQHSIQQAKLISFKGSVNRNKVFLEWAVKENETADQFQVEKSTDGKKFVMAALVFGTDKAETANYGFYEKASNKKISYRIKLINKDQRIEYSAVIGLNPGTTSNQ
jgi:hypothetical protein